MSIEVKAPAFPESVAQGTLVVWHKKAGDAVVRDELLADVETEKVTMEVVALKDGILQEILKAEGEVVNSQELIARIDEQGVSKPVNGAAQANTELPLLSPQFPESVSEGKVLTWHKSEGDRVERDEILVDVETDKVVLEVAAPQAGTLQSIVKEQGAKVLSQEVLATIQLTQSEAAPVLDQALEAPEESTQNTEEEIQVLGVFVHPAARKLAQEKGIDLEKVIPSAKGGRVSKTDVIKYIDSLNETTGSISAEEQTPQQKIAASPMPSQVSVSSVVPDIAGVSNLSGHGSEREERRVPMSRLRASIAKRLVQAQQNAAMLTTFNEVNMQPLMDLRKKYQDEFVETHSVKLGFMSLFVKASSEALKRFPQVNASIDGEDIVYHGYYDIGVAVSSERGLVVPVLRDADNLTLAEIEQQILRFGSKAKEGKLSIEEMSGGTFTISNGGVFGSLMSTPILNPPQTAILGMHKIQERPMAVNGQVVILPMMYLALSYDHRLIDGREAVRFLVTIKELIEEPTRLLLGI